jgi:hypothetical protein
MEVEVVVDTILSNSSPSPRWEDSTMILTVNPWEVEVEGTIHLALVVVVTATVQVVWVKVKDNTIMTNNSNNNKDRRSNRKSF